MSEAMTRPVDGAKLLELAEKIEAAAGADRELDADIACLIGRPLGNIGHWLHGDDISYRPTAYGQYVAVIPVESGETRTSEAFRSAEFTASIDAALTLVPEGWNWMAGNRYQPVARAYVENGAPSFTGIGQRQNPDRVWHEVVAATPALALTAACLRARALSPQPGDDHDR